MAQPCGGKRVCLRVESNKDVQPQVATQKARLELILAWPFALSQSLRAQQGSNLQPTDSKSGVPPDAVLLRKHPNPTDGYCPVRHESVNHDAIVLEEKGAANSVTF